MHRLLVETDELKKAEPTLPKAALCHLKVLRPKAGEEIELFDGRGSWRTFRYTAVPSAPLAAVADLERMPPPACALTLFACVTKGSRWDWTIEKATELGATRIVPVISERTIVRLAAAERAAKRERWQRVAEDAARQSDAKWLPEIVSPLDFADTLPLVGETVCFVGALANPPPKPIGAALAERLGGDGAIPAGGIAVYVGPEGDFSPHELNALCACATPVTFGTTVLRAETAAIYGLSAIKTYLDVHVQPR